MTLLHVSTVTSNSIPATSLCNAQYSCMGQYELKYVPIKYYSALDQPTGPECMFYATGGPQDT